MRILLPIDGSSFSDAAVDEVGGRPWPVPTEVKIVTAFQVPITPNSSSLGHLKRILPRVGASGA